MSSSTQRSAHAPALRDHRKRVAAGVFVVAGVYQFTPLKKRCLTSCRSPFTFIAQRWRGGNDGWNALVLGVDHGWFCVGCCWSLMLLMFAVGMTNVGFMMLIGLVMAVEKNVARAAPLGPVLGVVLLAIARLVAQDRLTLRRRAAGSWDRPEVLWRTGTTALVRSHLAAGIIRRDDATSQE